MNYFNFNSIFRKLIWLSLSMRHTQTPQSTQLQTTLIWPHFRMRNMQELMDWKMYFFNADTIHRMAVITNSVVVSIVNTLGNDYLTHVCVMSLCSHNICITLNRQTRTCAQNRMEINQFDQKWFHVVMSIYHKTKRNRKNVNKKKIENEQTELNRRKERKRKIAFGSSSGSQKD